MSTKDIDSGADLETVDELCRLALSARRLGCRIHLVGAASDLRALIDLAGVGYVLADCPCPDSSAPRPNPGDLS